MRPYPFHHAHDVSRRFFAFDMFETLVHNEKGTVLPIFETLCTYYPGVAPEDINAAYHDMTRAFKDENSNRELPLSAIVCHLDRCFGFNHRPSEMEGPLLRDTRLYGPAKGAAEALRYLKDKGYRIGVLSNTRYRTPVLKAILEDSGLLQYVDAVVTSADMGYRKPSSQSYNAILSALGCHAKECFFCGDSESNDYFGPLSMGFKGAVHLSGEKEQRERGIVLGIGDLPGLFENPPQA